MTEQKRVRPIAVMRHLANNLASAIAREPVLAAFAVALLTGCAIYRFELGRILYGGHAAPLGFDAGHTPLWVFLKSTGSDLLTVVLLLLPCLGLKAWLRFRAPRFASSTFARWTGVTAAAVALLAFTLILRSQFQLILEMESGLTVVLLLTASRLLGARDFLSLFKVNDVLFLVVPIVVFGAALIGIRRNNHRLAWGLLSLTTAIILLQAVPPYSSLASELRMNPLAYLTVDALKAPINSLLGKSNPYHDRRDLPGTAQMQSIPLIDEAFVSANAEAVHSPPPRVPAPNGQPWNVLLIVMESAGADYVFDSANGQEIPMPFLRQMADEGLYFTNHHAAANSSPSAVFSIFTGLYPVPTREQFALTKDIAIPTLNRFFGEQYDCFLVHASSLTYSFPQHLFRNGGITELIHQDIIPKGPEKDLTNLARDEPKAVSALLERLDRAHEPFLAIYWSFIPHHPYADYGPEFRVRHDLNTKRDRYLNNLRTLDVQLRRIHEHLDRTRLTDRTLLVFVGDHGEAFGQHPGVWTHSVGSYSEMFRAPVIFWQPRLTAPTVIQYPTSHVDILPTMLDLAGVTWEQSRLQGASALRGEPARKYIFSMDGLANYLTSIDRQMNKVTLDFENGGALVYNLTKDPGEKVPLNDANFRSQIDDLLKYRNYQTRLIIDYNAALLAKRPFPSNSSN